MKRELPELSGIPFSPSELKHIHTKIDYGATVRVRLLCIFPVLLIELYQRRTVNRPHVCNFYPSCSEYARLAYIRYGFFAASFLTIERLQNCNWFTDWPPQNKP